MGSLFPGVPVLGSEDNTKFTLPAPKFFSLQLLFGCLGGLRLIYFPGGLLPHGCFGCSLTIFNISGWSRTQWLYFGVDLRVFLLAYTVYALVVGIASHHTGDISPPQAQQSP